MKYSEIIEIEPFFDSTFNMTEEKENYWKQFITNEKFESNLKEIVNAFTSLTGDQHKSIWVQGTYGTGKSHSTAVIKHLLSDDLDDITDYIDKLANPQLKGMLINFRKKERVFPVVLKGTYSIVDTEELKYTIQRAVTQQLNDAGVNITVKSDFQAVIEMLEDKKFSSFWESMLKNELDRYASSIDELKEALEIGDVNVLKEINIALKKSNMIKATPDIKQWLTEVMDALRKQNVADYLVIFWDEFTSLLEITERRSILNCMHIPDIREDSLIISADKDSMANYMEEAYERNSRTLFNECVANLSRDAAFMLVADMNKISRNPERFEPYLPAFLLENAPLFHSFILSTQLSVVNDRLSHIMVLTYKD